ncbi:MAG: CRISPR-associated endonuclease Cas2 [Fimbriimonadaceae bacterium]
MWLLVMFDLPTETRQQRTEYRRFRDRLLDAGFMMLQYSVYARPCPTSEDAKKHEARVEGRMPPQGEVRTLTISSLEYAKMKVFFGEIARPPEKEPQQLSFF